MNDFQIIQQNIPFLGSVYNLKAIGFLAGFLGFLVVWELIWKAFALWRAARLKQVVWFIALVSMNTAGVLPIVYLLTSRTAYRNLLSSEEKEEMKAIIADVQAGKNQKA